jgi:serine/threonine protein kinase
MDITPPRSGTSDGPAPEAPTLMQVDQICDAFEAAWKNIVDSGTSNPGPRPRIEEFLGNSSEINRTPLFKELLKVELAYRRRLGEVPSLEDYRHRFADFFDELVFEVFSGDDSVSSRGSLTGPIPPQSQNLHRMTGLAGYEILEELGRGGMGVVYKARQVGLKRIVALKMIRPEVVAGRELLTRFRIEAEAAGRLQHPNIVQIFEIDESEGRPFFSMEFAEGGSLDKRLGGVPLPPRPAAELAQTLARAVHHAHQRNVLHRDLKPSNVLLTADSRPMISDFGLAKRLDSESTLTPSHGVILGTACYMAPEQAEGKTKEIGKPADIYALGAIFYELLTGRPPLRAENWQATVHMVIYEHPEPPTHLRPEIPRELEAICLKCLEKRPDQRYATAEDLAEDLRRFLAAEPISLMTMGEQQWLAVRARRAGYDLLEEIGRGPNSVVYRARHARQLRPLALKMISIRSPIEPRHLRRVWEKATWMIKALAFHEGVVRLDNFGELDGMIFLAMDFIPGGSLAQRLTGTPYRVEEAVRVVENLAQTMRVPHSREILHGNLKPSNIFLTGADIPRISDFDVTVNLGLDVILPPGLASGPSDYKAPEQAAGRGAEIGPTADVYALGAILYHLLTGQTPLSDASRQAGEEQKEISLAAILRHIMAGQPPPPATASPELPISASEVKEERTPDQPLNKPDSQVLLTPRQLRPEVPPELEAICLKCLEVDPAKRYQNTRSLAEDLKRFLTAKENATSRGVEKHFLPGYEILDVMGQGLEATVYKGRDIEADRLVAIRVIQTWRHSPPEDLKSFLLAATILADLHHPNIVEVYKVGQWLRFPYFIMEFVPGGSLSQLLVGNPWNARKAAELLHKLATATQFAHAHQIVHGDLKPAHVLFTSYGIPKIKNFGSARLLKSDWPEIARDQPIGTTTHKAPEQTALHGKEIGPGPDIHALGTILYEMLAGQPPFRGASVMDLVQGVISQEVKPPSHFQPDVPRDLERICMKCLQKERQKRYPSAAALATDLQHFLAGEPLAFHQDEDSTDSPQITIPTQSTKPSTSPTSRAGLWARLTRWLTPKDVPPESAAATNLLHAIWDGMDPQLQDAFSLAYNKKRREGSRRISTRDLFQALTRLQDVTLRTLIESLPPGSLPEPMADDVKADRRLSQENPLLSDCIQDSLSHFAKPAALPRKLTPVDVFVDIGKHGHGPSVARLRARGVTPEELERQVERLGLSVIRREITRGS